MLPTFCSCMAFRPLSIAASNHHGLAIGAHKLSQGLTCLRRSIFPTASMTPAIFVARRARITDAGPCTVLAHRIAVTDTPLLPAEEVGSLVCPKRFAPMTIPCQQVSRAVTPKAATLREFHPDVRSKVRGAPERTSPPDCGV